jgi:Fe-S-cluster containining protein
MSIIESKAFGQRPYFFDAGLDFTCRQCGACCTGEPGTVYVSADEIRTIAAFIGIPAEAFMDQWLFAFKDSYSIQEEPNGNCPFFKDKCTIYPVRPLQCRTYPFWFANLRSEGCWARTTARCPGIGSGRHYSRDEILASIHATVHL